MTIAYILHNLFALKNDANHESDDVCRRRRKRLKKIIDS